MKASSILANVCIILFIGSAVLSNDAIEWQQFTVKDLHTILNDTTSTSYIFHFRGQNCSSECQTELALIKKHASSLIALTNDVKIHSAELDTEGVIAEELAIDSGSALIYLYKGHSIRIDVNDIHPKQEVDLIKETTKVLTNKPQLIGSREEFLQLNSTNKFLHVFNGNESSIRWVEIELASKMTSTPIHFIRSPELAKELEIKKRGSFSTIETSKNLTVPLEQEVSFDSIHYFLQTSVSPIPVDFNAEEVRKATNAGLVALFVKGSSVEETARLVRLLRDVDISVKNHFIVYELTDENDKEQKAMIDFCTKEDNKEDYVFCIVYSHQGKLTRFILDEHAVGYKHINKFISRYIDGKLLPYYLSETIKKRFVGEVRNLNTYTLDEILDPKEGDFALRVILYYNNKTENDGLQEVFQRVAKEFDELKAKFGRINADKNEILDDINQTIPYIRLLRSHGDPQGDVYKGSFEYDALYEWVKGHVEKRDEEVKQLLGNEDEDL